ncbi:MAG: hypothetical protein Q7V57_09555 [Actinomycetota bacterium]|nr:hypothetical protein [Actinomycetota bacterium]
MSDNVTDDKITRLVHSVLEAVDLRLAEVRHEILVLGEDIGLRRLEVQEQIQDLSRRIDHLAAEGGSGSSTSHDGDPSTAALLEQLESKHRRDAEHAEQRITQLEVALAQMKASAAITAPHQPASTLAPPPAATPSSTPSQGFTPSLPTLSRVTAPLITSTPTTEVAPARATTTGEHNIIQEGEQIDLDRLTDLLTERLGQLDLPHARKS